MKGSVTNAYSGTNVTDIYKQVMDIGSIINKMSGKYMSVIGSIYYFNNAILFSGNNYVDGKLLAKKFWIPVMDKLKQS